MLMISESFPVQARDYKRGDRRNYDAYYRGRDQEYYGQGGRFEPDGRDKDGRDKDYRTPRHGYKSRGWKESRNNETAGFGTRHRYEPKNHSHDSYKGARDWTQIKRKHEEKTPVKRIKTNNVSDNPPPAPKKAKRQLESAKEVFENKEEGVTDGKGKTGAKKSKRR